MNINFIKARKYFHAALYPLAFCGDEQSIPTNADKNSQSSVKIAKGIWDRIGADASEQRLADQGTKKQFEVFCKQFIEETLFGPEHIRSGLWSVELVWSRNRSLLTSYEQFTHLAAVVQAAKQNPDLANGLNSDYMITPDIVISYAVEDGPRNYKQKQWIADIVAFPENEGKKSSLLPMLHASISCKWTIRNDHSQPSRAEALNLIGNRKGQLPRILVVTGEPLPARIATVAMGTGNIDCVYHFALAELRETLKTLNYLDSLELLQIMIEAKRLKDISDLPFDLAVCG